MCIVTLKSKVKACIHYYIFIQGATSVRFIFQPEKRLRKERKNINSPSIGQLEKRTSYRTTDAV